MPLPRSPLIGLALLACTPLSCGSDLPGPADEHVTHIGQSIMGGQDDHNDPAVVGILAIQGWSAAMCTGSLIAPNLILTARHCVAETESMVQCGVSMFGATFAAKDFFITTKWDGIDQAMSGNVTGMYRASAIIVPSGNAVCGGDVALIRLQGAGIPANVAQPIVPRVDQIAYQGESYRAVGYGATNDQGSGSGFRRNLEPLAIHCVGNCSKYVLDNEREWQGEKGICQGDSGGPALDSVGRVIGVVSRGGANCSQPIYGSVFGWADWIKQHAIESAQAGGYDPPAWASGSSTDPDAGAGGGGGGPVENGAPGAPCNEATECTSGICVAENNLTRYCSEACSAEDPSCPEGFECVASAGACFMPGGFAAPCTAGDQCRSGTCVSAEQGTYCSQMCATDSDCPQPASCALDLGACFLPPASAAQPLTDADSESGCSISPASRRVSDPTKPIPWYFGLPLLLLLLRSRRQA